MKCIGCEHLGKYPRLIVRWCEAFTPGVINHGYPNPVEQCPKMSNEQQEEDTMIEEYW